MILWIADIDGVFTDFYGRPNEKAIFLSATIGSREPFTYVTGRGAKWLTRHFLPTLKKIYQEKPPRLGLICAEYGGVILRWQKGQWHKEHNPQFPALDDLRDKLRSQIAKVPGVFFDEEKEVMITIEAKHDLRATDHNGVEKGLRIAEQLLQGQVKIHPGLEYQRTTYACDLIPKGMNKAYGTSHILAHVGGGPEHVHLLGDSYSDLLLADPIRARHLSYTIHFVGDETALTAKLRKKYSIEISPKQYAEGTVEVLQQFL